jgi:hypothetical protein
MNECIAQCALLVELVNEKRTLLPSDCNHARDLCLKLSQLTLDLKDLPESAITETPGMMRRIMLYSNENIEIRAHIFNDGCEETYIHNHGQAFITTCLQGGYVHKIWQVNGKRGVQFYEHNRAPGGVYQVQENTAVNVGNLVDNVVSHPFASGQSLYIGDLAQHTVGECSDQLVTLVIRDKVKTAGGSTILSLTETMEEGKAELVQPIVGDEDRKETVQLFNEALSSYRRATREAEHEVCFDSPLKVIFGLHT